ncbi:chromate transporter [Nonomuraea sp. NPDC002799]
MRPLSGPRPRVRRAGEYDELVRRRGWVGDARFLDLMGATNLIPGPNSTELAIHLGFDRARRRGLLAAGVCFILPAALIVTAPAWAYVTYGSTPAAEGLLYGIVPVVIAIIAHALSGLLRRPPRQGAGLRGRSAPCCSCSAAPPSSPTPLTTAIAVIALGLLWRTRINNAWLTAGGLLHSLLT